MPNNKRARIGQVDFVAECVLRLLKNGITIEFTTKGQEFLFTQLVCMLDPDGSVIGEDIVSMNPWVIRHNSGKSLFIQNGSKIEFTGTGAEHDFAVIRGDIINKEAKNLIFNMISPQKKKIIIQYM